MPYPWERRPPINYTIVRYYHRPEDPTHAHKAIGDPEAAAAEDAGFNYITRADLTRIITRRKVEALSRFGEINQWSMNPTCPYADPDAYPDETEDDEDEYDDEYDDDDTDRYGYPLAYEDTYSDADPGL